MKKYKNILITGAGGFVGRNLSEYFSDKYKVYSCTHKDLDLLNEEEVEQFFRNKSIDVVIHCANIGGARKNNYDKSSNDIVNLNLRMFFNLVRCLNKETLMIHLGSGAEYDKRNGLCKVSEADFDIFVPKDSYGYSKYVISQYINKSTDIVCLRIFGLYGQYEDYTYKFISNTIVKNLLNMPIVINQNVIFDYLYIDDLCKITAQILERKPKYKAINVTPTESIDLVSIANIVNQVGDYRSEIIVLNEGLNTEYTGDNTRFLESSQDFNFVSYREGIKKLYSYYKANLSKINVEIIKQDPYLKNCSIKK